MPSWEQLYRDSQKGLVRFLTIAVNEGGKDLRRLVAQEGISMPILMDETGDTARSFGVRALPTFIFLDQRGRIAGRFVGPQKWAPEELSLLAGQ